MASLNPDLTSDVRIQYRNQILYLRNAIDELIKDPNKVVKLNGFIPNMSVGIGGDSISMEYDRNGYDNEEDLALPRPSAEVEEILRAAKNTIVDPKRKPKRSFDSVTGTENDPDSKVNHSSSETNSVNSKGTDRRGIAGGCSFRNLPDVGLTTVNIDGQSENPKYFYCQPVYLAPLQRKKISQNVSGKVVPLMEPDIGSHFFIEFVPIFVSNSLDRSLKALPHGNHYNGPYSDGVLPDIDI